jgi:AcrR family transcriptional regulator
MTSENQATSPTDPAQPYHHGDLRNALIRASLDILGESGVPGLSLRAAARRAGVSHAAPRRHFADKEALLAAVAEEGFQRLANRVGDVRRRFPLDARLQLREAGSAYVQCAVTHPALFRVMFGGLIQDLETYPGLRSAASRAFDCLVQIVRAGQESGVFVAGSPRDVALVAWSLVHGLATLLVDSQIPADVRIANDPDQLARRCATLFYEGIEATRNSPQGCWLP